MGITQRSFAERGGAEARATPRGPYTKDLQSQGGPAISVSVARTLSERRAAADLIKARYASRGYLVSGFPPPTAEEFTLIAADAGATVGTLTLRFDGPDGLHADESYREEVDAARAAGRRVCEIGRFAVAPEVRSTPVLAALFACAHTVVRELKEATDVFIEVNPRHADFYRKLFGFVVAAGERICPRVLAPSVLLRVDVAAFEARMQEYALALLPQRTLVAPLVLN